MTLMRTSFIRRADNIWNLVDWNQNTYTFFKTRIINKLNGKKQKVIRKFGVSDWTETAVWNYDVIDI